MPGGMPAGFGAPGGILQHVDNVSTSAYTELLIEVLRIRQVRPPGQQWKRHE